MTLDFNSIKRKRPRSKARFLDHPETTLQDVYSMWLKSFPERYWRESTNVETCWTTKSDALGKTQRIEERKAIAKRRKTFAAHMAYNWWKKHYGGDDNGDDGQLI